MKTKHYIIAALIFVIGCVIYAIYMHKSLEEYAQKRAIKCIEKGFTQSEYAVISINEEITISYEAAKNLYEEQKAREKNDSIYLSLVDKLGD